MTFLETLQTEWEEKHTSATQTWAVESQDQNNAIGRRLFPIRRFW